MGRKHREQIPGATYHVFSRCIDTQNMMRHDSIKDQMLLVIKETQERYEFELNSLVILDNHFHFLIRTTNNTDTISRIMQRIKSVFAKRYNKLQGRRGPFWNERFGCSIIEKAKDSAKYIIHLLWYMAYNSVRKGRVADPRDDKYSLINAYLDKNYSSPVKITLHRGFLNLGKTFKEQLKVFLEYEKTYLDYLWCQR